ncbi:MAG TPA: alpha-amylase domain-containing protein [Abditibacteriaceae bacterium]
MKPFFQNRLARLLLSCALFLSFALPVRAGVMLQGFYWDVPSPGAGTSGSPWWWDKMGGQAAMLRQAGFTAVWLPPVHKGAGGGYSVGYDTFDDYDLGSKDQMGTIPTRYGTREQLQKCIAMMRANGLQVYVDLVHNHRNGDDGNYNFRYVNAYGVPNSGRFQKGPLDFHPNVPQDPHVPDDTYQFGRDLAPVNGSGGYCYFGLRDAGEWLIKALDIQGFRLDNVKGISAQWLREFMSHGKMNGKFAVGEYFDGNMDALSYWIGTNMQGKASLFDFPLYFKLKEMCDGGGFFDMSTLDHAGLAGRDPSHAVTFVENHDTDRSHPITQNKLLAYAYILTSEGYPCVYYKDYSTDSGSYGLKAPLDNLIWIHEKLAGGDTVQRYKSGDVFAYERTGGPRLLVGLNDNGSSWQTITVATGFGANVKLHDYAGRSGDVWTDNNGNVTIGIPPNNGGTGYVCYSRDGQGGSFSPPTYSVTQEFAGASDLDIKPADNKETVTVGRVYAAAGTALKTAMYWDKTGWSNGTGIYLQAYAPNGTKLWHRVYYKSTPEAQPLVTTVKTTGWHTYRIRSFNTPTSNPKPAYWLQATYTAPRS